MNTTKSDLLQMMTNNPLTRCACLWQNDKELIEQLKLALQDSNSVLREVEGRLKDLAQEQIADNERAIAGS